MADDDIVTSPFDKDDPLTAAADQGDNMGRSLADDLEVDIGSTEGSHSFRVIPFLMLLRALYMKSK
jgi:hypothetical protein